MQRFRLSNLMFASLLILSCLSSLVAAPDASAAAAEEGSMELYQISDPRPKALETTARIAGAVQEVTIDLDAGVIDKVPETLSFALPDGRRFKARQSHFVAEKGYSSWSGRVVENDGSESDGTLGFVHLIDRGQEVSGTINLGAERYQIVAVAGEHRIVRIELEEAICFYETPEGQLRSHASHSLATAADIEAGDDLREAPSSGLTDPAGQAAASGASEAPLGSEKMITDIDVLAIYPNAFSGSSEAAVRQFIDDSIFLANGVLANSNVNARYRLVGMEKLVGQDQPPATGLLGGIEWMTPTQVGGQDVDLLGPQEMIDLRDEHAADMVALFIPFSYNNTNACGIANIPLANGDVRPYIDGQPSPGDFGKRAYTVHRSGCGLNDYTLAHELGHNMGMRHGFDENTDGSNHLFPYGRGHQLSWPTWNDIANGTLQTNVGGNFTVGYHFTPQMDGYVLSLGGLFNGTKRVRLWEYASGALLADEYVEGDNTWRYEELANRVEVEAGTRYTVAVHINGTGGSIYNNVIPFPRDAAQVTIHSSTSIAGNGRPTNTVLDKMYGQADIRFVPTQALGSSVLGCSYVAGNIADEVCNRIPFLSDPSINVGAFFTGTATRNNAAVARQQAAAYAAFRTNGAPVCQDDTLTTPSGDTLSVAWGNLLGNDSDPDGDQLRVDDYDGTTAQGGSNDGGHAGGFNYTPPSGGFTGQDWFSYTVSDRPDEHGAAQFDTCTVYVQVTGVEQEIGEVGEVTTLRHVPHTVMLQRTFANPVVIAQTLTWNGSDPSVVRLTDVQSDRFTFYVDEAPDRDGPHTFETVSYLVLEKGQWHLANGAKLDVGTVQTSATVGRMVLNQWQYVGFSGSSGAGSIPAFFSQVQTNNDPSWVKTRHLSVSASGAYLGLEKEEANASSHGSESVGWMALQKGSGSWNGQAYLAGQTPVAVSSSWYTINFATPITNPRFFTALRTYNGADNSCLRYGSLSSSLVQVRVEEDTTFDPEVNHTSEAVDYFVLSGSGLLTGFP